MPTKEEARQKVGALVAKCQALPAAQSHYYDIEENTKKDFILPLFSALGWDTENATEVAAEEAASKGRVDYAFKINGVSRLYLEAKPLNADLNNPEYVKQVITYAYNKGVTWAGLTNFKSLQVFNALDASASFSAARFPNLDFNNYLADLDTLWLLSKESLISGDLDREAAKLGKMPTRLPIEKRLYSQLKRWREQLFSQLANYDHSLTREQTDEVIQRLFNRLIFIRTCEDRNIEEKVLLSMLHQWQNQALKGELLHHLQRIFKQFEGYYDSELFATHLLDSKQVFIEALTIEQIINGLYDIPGGLASYDFAAIDSDILGAVYEQYLGHVAEVAKQRHQAAQSRMNLGLTQDTVFELTAKKQKRKEHGIYYTPKWVVDYIVQQTVGRFIEEHRTRPDAIHDIKVLDPACGSGSFLIRSYDSLLRWHAESSGRPESHVFGDERAVILKHSVFGVDLDRQAVEIARLNLLLRSLAHRDILPPLSDNIRQGNSLISGNETELKPFFGDTWEHRRPFNWDNEFPRIMAQGGFDVVVGNPPYIRIQTLPRDEADYYRSKYESAHGSFDIYVMFIERGLQLLKPGGRLGFITSGKFLKADYGKGIQHILDRDATIEGIIDLSAQQIFGEATTYPVILVIQKGHQKRAFPYKYVEQLDADSPGLDIATLPEIKVDQDAITKGVWPPAASTGTDFLAKLTEKSEPLGHLVDKVFQGLRTSDNKVFVVRKVADDPKLRTTRVVSTLDGQPYDLETAALRLWVPGEALNRYSIELGNLYVIVPYAISSTGYRLLTEPEMQEGMPLTWSYLNGNKARLSQREQGKMNRDGWYGYVYPKNLHLFSQPKLVTADTAKINSYAADPQGNLWFTSGYGLYLSKDTKESISYLLSLLNSRLMTAVFFRWSTQFQGGYNRFFTKFQTRFPIRRIDFAHKVDKQAHDHLAVLAERMLELHRRLLAKGKIPDTETQDIQREIARTDHEIDTLVYDLYGLTATERQIVEDSVPASKP